MFCTLITSLVLSRLDHGTVQLAFQRTALLDFSQLWTWQHGLSAFFRSHHRCSSRSPLASFPGKTAVQRCCAYIQSLTQICADVTESISLCLTDVPGCGCLHHAHTNRLIVLPIKLSAVRRRTFPVDRYTVWNNLPAKVPSAQLLSTFCQRLNIFCSWSHFLTSSWILANLLLILSGFRSDLHHLEHFENLGLTERVTIMSTWGQHCARSSQNFNISTFDEADAFCGFVDLYNV